MMTVYPNATTRSTRVAMGLENESYTHRTYFVEYVRDNQTVKRHVFRSLRRARRVFDRLVRRMESEFT